MTQAEIGAFLLNAPFFKKYDMSTLGGDPLDVLFYNGAIDSFCPQCGSLSIFLGINDDDDRLQEKTNLALRLNMYGSSPKNLDLSGIYRLDFNCSRIKDHQLNIVLKVDEQKVSKIGQSPSALEILQGDFKQYKTLLGANFEDLYSAVILYSNSFGVAAFTHLRRIIENYFLKQAFITWQQHNSTSLDPQFEGLRFKEKTNLVKDYLPQAFTENTTLYSIASNGIHSLTNEECMQYFPPLRDCILLCLEQIISEQRKLAKQESIKKSLNEISSLIKKNSE